MKNISETSPDIALSLRKKLSYSAYSMERVIKSFLKKKDWHWQGSKSVLQAKLTKAYDTMCVYCRLTINYVLNIIFFSLFFQSQVLILLNMSLLEGDYEINTVTGGVNASGQRVL